METWITESITINGDLSYALRRGEINTNYVDIEVVAYSDRWNNFDALIEFREREGGEWRSDMQISFSTANSIDKNRLRNLACASNGGLNLIRWKYPQNGLKYGQKPDIRLKILPRYLNFSTSSISFMMSENSGINFSKFIDASTWVQPINLNQSGQTIALTSDSVRIYNDLSSSYIYEYSGLSNPSFSIQINDGSYFIADTDNNQVLEVSEDFTSVINTIAVTSPVFLDYIEDNDTLLVTSSGGTIYEYVRGSFILVWTSTTSFGELSTATYSKKDFNRIVTCDSQNNQVRIIDRITNLTTTHFGFSNFVGETDSFIKPHIAVEFEDGSLTVVERIGRVATFEQFTSSSSSSLDSSSESSMTSSSLSSSSSSEGYSTSSSSSSEGVTSQSNSSSSQSNSSSSQSESSISLSESSLQYSSSSSTSSEGYSSSSSTSSEGYSESSSTSSEGYSESSSSSSTSSLGYSSSSSYNIDPFNLASFTSYWKMEEAEEGTRFDYQGNNDLSEGDRFIPRVAGKNKEAAGQFLDGLERDAVTDLIPTDSMIFSSWVKVDYADLVTGSGSQIMTWDSTSYQLSVASNSLYARVRYTSGIKEVSGPITEGVHHIFLVATKTSLKLFLDGGLLDSETFSTQNFDYFAGYKLVIGGSDGSLRAGVDGFVDEVGFWMDEDVDSFPGYAEDFAAKMWNGGNGLFPASVSSDSSDSTESFDNVSSSSDSDIYNDWNRDLIDRRKNSGFTSSMAMVNGQPAVAYYAFGIIFYSRYNGSEWEAPVLVDNTNIRTDTAISMAVVDGNPAITYSKTTNPTFTYVRATNSDGSSWGTPINVTPSGTFADDRSLAIINGNPAIAFWNFDTGGGLKYVRATDSTGSSWGSVEDVDLTSNNYGTGCSLLQVDGQPAISYTHQGAGNNAVLYYNRYNGASWVRTAIIGGSGQGIGFTTTLKFVNGNPAIAYRDDSGIKFIRSNNSTGSSWPGSEVTVASLSTAMNSSMEIVGGDVAIAYYGRSIGSQYFTYYVVSSDINGGTGSWSSPSTIQQSPVNATSVTTQEISLVDYDGVATVAYYEASYGEMKVGFDINERGYSSSSSSQQYSESSSSISSQGYSESSSSSSGAIPMFQTTSASPDVFAPFVFISGETVTWILGDGNQVTSNGPLSHVYTDGEPSHNVEIQASNPSNLTSINVDSEDITSIDLSYFPGLENLNCANNTISSLDISTNSSLDFLNCNNNNISSLDLSNNTLLEIVRCNNNNLTSLDLSNNSNVTIFDCSNNNISSLTNLSGSIDEIDVSDNNLSSLDTSSITSATTITCSGNVISSLDVSVVTGLETLYCGGNSFSSIDISSNSSLITFSCDSTSSLTSVNLGSSSVETIALNNNNNLTSVDISSSSSVTSIACANSGLTSANVASSTVTAITFVNNSLTSLDVSSCTALDELFVTSNNLSSSAVNTILIDLDNNGLSNGNVQLNGQSPSAPPTGGGITAKANLQAKGWTVVTD